MKDIETRADIELLLSRFYSRLLQDESVNYIFTDVAKINLEEHLPKITDFWEQSLLHTGNYRTNVMQVHLDLNAKEHFTEKHFSTWLTHFFAVTDDLFKGIVAEAAKTKALSIATIMKIKMYNDSNTQ
ncbi:MAG: group III truncated hemoglobin [Flavobacterium sp.]|nr:MAG: group III truncated hemoglobin [Flavobacterium sp.]